MEKNTQQPVVLTDDEIRREWFSAGGRVHGPRVETVTMPEADYFAFRRAIADRKTAPPVPRDVLIDAMQEVLDECLDHLDGPKFAIDLAAIADRYASQVQPDRNTVTLEEMVAKLKAVENGDAISEAMTQATADMALGRAIREGHATHPEPVNQQLLAALKRLLASYERMKNGERPSGGITNDARAAIAAAEAAQGERNA